MLTPGLPIVSTLWAYISHGCDEDVVDLPSGKIVKVGKFVLFNFKSVISSYSVLQLEPAVLFWLLDSDARVTQQLELSRVRMLGRVAIEDHYCLREDNYYMYQ